MLSLFERETRERGPVELIQSGLAVIDAAFETRAKAMLPLFSGGHDSLCACFIASRHPRFDGTVHHIDTTIGAKAARVFVEDTCREMNWQLKVWRSNFSYERFVRRLGFPGPGVHSWVYRNLKDRCVSSMTKGRGRAVLVSGARAQESVRRMGSVRAVAVGETSKRTGITRRPNRIWTSPCHDWSTDEQLRFMEYFDLPRNGLKDSPIGMSGECFCGAFARPGELELIRVYAPDVAAEIDRLAGVAAEAGRHCIWGTRQKSERGLIAVETGPLCSSCDARAWAAGLLFEQ